MNRIGRIEVADVGGAAGKKLFRIHARHSGRRRRVDQHGRPENDSGQDALERIPAVPAKAPVAGLEDARRVGVRGGLVQEGSKKNHLLPEARFLHRRAGVHLLDSFAHRVDHPRILPRVEKPFRPPVGLFRAARRIMPADIGIFLAGRGQAVQLRQDPPEAAFLPEQEVRIRLCGAQMAGVDHV